MRWACSRLSSGYDALSLCLSLLYYGEKCLHGLQTKHTYRYHRYFPAPPWTDFSKPDYILHKKDILLVLKKGGVGNISSVAALFATELLNFERRRSRGYMYAMTPMITVWR